MSPDIAKAFTYFLAMVLCLSVHEACHALAAKLLGDRTAEAQGRLTLNPIAHMDPLGTVIFPIMGALLHFPVIGWAKPVPVNTRYLKNPKLGGALIASAGPASNLAFCVLCILVYQLYLQFGQAAIPQGSFFYPFIELTQTMVVVNAALAFFNLIPLPPLDGAGMLGLFLSQRALDKYEEVIAPYGYMILLVLMFSRGLAWVSTLAILYIQIVYSIIERLF